MWFERAYGYEIGVPFVGNKTEYATFKEYIVDLISFAILIGSMVAVLVIVYGAYLYVTSSGDEAKAKSGKDIVVGSLTGFILLILIRLLVPVLGIQ